MSHDSSLYLWDRRSLFIGHLKAPLKLCQAAACLTVSLGEPIRFKRGPDSTFRETLCILTPAGCDHEIDTCGEFVANLMLDPFGEDYAMLSSVMVNEAYPSSGIYFNSPHKNAYRNAFLEIHQQSFDYNLAYQKLDSALQNGVDANLPEYKIDPRVIRVVNELKNQVHENLSIEDLAELANVSVSRLVQIFKQQTGIPIRRYRSWHRLFVASATMAQTGSLTDAAVVAGFSDASHFTKTFQSMIGMSPSAIFSGSGKVRLFVKQ